jgi:hypothetical protein
LPSLRDGTQSIPIDKLDEWVQSIPPGALDRWLDIAARAEREGRESALAAEFQKFRKLALEHLGIDLVKPLPGTLIQPNNTKVEDSSCPLDGVVTEVVRMGLQTSVRMGLQTSEKVLRKAVVKSRAAG